MPLEESHQWSVIEGVYLHNDLRGQTRRRGAVIVALNPRGENTCGERARRLEMIRLVATRKRAPERGDRPLTVSATNFDFARGYGGTREFVKKITNYGKRSLTLLKC